MKVNCLRGVIATLVCVVFSYAAYSQDTKTVPISAKSVAPPTVVVNDAPIAPSTATVEAPKSAPSAVGVKRFGVYTVKLVDGVIGQTYEGGRWLTVKTWDGTRWAAKRTWFPDKKKND